MPTSYRKSSGTIIISNPLVSSLKLKKLRVVPSEFIVKQNYPNPFNPVTRIDYGIPAQETVEIVIYNTLGQQVKQLFHQEQPAGYYSLTWDGTGQNGERAASGIYIYRVRAGEQHTVRKMLLIR